MACFNLLDAWKSDSGEIKFFDNGGGRYLQLPCGQCVGCRLERSRQWAVRCMHEASMHEHSCFVTLTFDQEHLPTNGSLDYRPFQLFMKRVRKSSGCRVRFFMAGEYGDMNWRPHFHALLFGVNFSDRCLLSHLDSGSDIYRSESLNALWREGYSSVGDVTFESAAYVARYCLKKVTGPAALDHYRRVDPVTGEVFSLAPEFCRMSLRPGIGAEWFKKFRSEVFPHDRVIVRGKVAKPPKYYSRLEGSSLDACAVEYDRHVSKLEQEWDCTPARLRVREQVTAARLSFRKRSLPA